MPLPAKITIKVLEPIDVTAIDDADAVYDTVLTRMQAALEELAAERHHVILG